MFDIIFNKDKSLTAEEIVDKWRRIGFLDGFLDGFPEEKMEILANNYENMAKCFIYDSDVDSNVNGSLGTIIFPIIRRVTSEVPIIFDCRMFLKYIINIKSENINEYLSDKMKNFIESYEKNGKIKDLFTSFDDPFVFGGEIEIDLEAELCASLSDYLINILKK